MRLGLSTGAWGATGLGLVALFVALGLAEPVALAGPDLCFFHRLTGIACPACGLTRAAAALARGDLAAALAWHPLFPVVALAIAAGWLVWGWSLVSGNPPHHRILSGLAVVTAGLLVAVWVVRWSLGALPS